MKSNCFFSYRDDHISDNIFQYKMPEAWRLIYGTWFPNSGYQPVDALPFEVYPDPPKDGKLTVEICTPLNPL